jgi:TRAP-type C4-dicarboxylate transport system permease small subunit
MIQRIRSFERKLVRFESLIAALSLLLLLVLSLVQIFIRNLLDFGYPEIDIINRNLLVVCGSMGAVLATSKFRHIKIDALTPILSAKTLQRLRIPLALFSAVVCCFMCYYGVIFVLDEWEYAPANERWTLPFTLIYPLGFCLIGFHFFATCFRDQTE